MAANTDKLRKKKSLFSTTLNGAISDSDATIALSSASGLPTDTAVTLTIDRVDANANSTPALRERITGVVVSNNVTNSLRGQDGSSAQAHNSGAVVEDIWDAETWNDLIDALLVEHTQAGAHGAITATSLVASGNATAANLKLAASGALLDANSNELSKFTQTASAVNEITIANAATGNNPVVQSSGSDTNIGLDVKMKGTGKFRRPTIVEIPIGSASADLATGDGQGFFRIPDELNGMNLTGVAASVYDAGTTGTLDVQIRNKTQAADMLTTKITIDSGETDTSTAATPAVIDAANDDVATGDIIAIDIDAVHTTPAQGLLVMLRFELP